MKPPGSGPGMAIFARMPAIRPTTIKTKMPIFASPPISCHGLTPGNPTFNIAEALFSYRHRIPGTYAL